MPIAAYNLLLAIHEAIRKLSYALNKPLVRDNRLAAMGYRWVGIKNYIVFYTVDEASKNVYVERILYGRRDWQQIL